MKILSRRNGPARSQDANDDGVVDGRDRAAVADRVDGRPVTTDEEPATYSSRATGRPHAAEAARARPGVDPDLALERTVDPDPAAEHTVDPDRDGRPDRPLDRSDVDDRTALGPKPRASLLATLGLIVSVASALFVLTGTLAGYGIGLGAIGAVLAVLGLVATRRRHVAGTTDALIGVVVGLAAVVLGIVAMTGQFDWPTTDGDWVGRFREWLDSQFAGLF
ncbi:hypothetical protein GA0074695_1355 [Micromonospora viridifaciens]|uniref:Thrombospondin n=1 Tax=Micromonospora viridifaciens TaxID=1881 RepID=A0A1C4VD41_MICVI|nr:thrombospondin [Micromonospora viridifaciens]SCE81826.1 hypothetical protein GA0074695_1355 [Micromonospora viridifaciens]